MIEWSRARDDRLVLFLRGHTFSFSCSVSRIPDPSKLARLAGIIQPTLVANGDNDTMIPTVNSYILAEHIPNARVRIFQDAGHRFLFQFPTEFAAIVASFLA